MKRALILTAILGALVGLAFLVARPHVPDPGQRALRRRARGSRAKAAGLEFTSSAAASRPPSIRRRVLHAGDALRFVVRGERPRHVEVRLRDGAAPAAVFPAAGDDGARRAARDAAGPPGAGRGRRPGGGDRAVLGSRRARRRAPPSRHRGRHARDREGVVGRGSRSDPAGRAADAAACRGAARPACRAARASAVRARAAQAPPLAPPTGPAPSPLPPPPGTA